MKRQELIYSGIGVVLIALFAQVSFNISPLDNLSIPITGQTLAVITIAMLARKEVGFLIVAGYLVAGGLGLPVFAHGASGWTHLIGNSAGYLWSFVIIPLLVGKSKNRHRSPTFASCFFEQLIGTAFILLCGTLFLSLKVGLGTALTYGFYPFVIGGLVKSGIGAYLVMRLSRLRFFQSL